MEANQKAPLVTIGVPVYNGGKYLEECLDSILNQSFTDWECVILNNCSIDNTKKIAEVYVARDKRFKLSETSELLPVASNWNYCFSKTNPDSKYYKLVLADDWIYPDFLSKMVGMLEQYPEAGFCSSYIIDDTSASCDGLDIYNGNRFDGKEVLFRSLIGELIVFGSANSILHNRSYLQKLSCYPDIYRADTFHMDTYLSYELLKSTDMCFIFEVLSYTRRHNETITKTVSYRLKTGLLFHERALFDFMEINPVLQKNYRKLRLNYAYTLLKSKITGNRELVDWHNRNLQRPFRTWEYLTAFVKRIIHKL